MRATRSPRSVASRATPAPVMPPPRTSRSKGSSVSMSMLRFMLSHAGSSTSKDPESDPHNKEGQGHPCENRYEVPPYPFAGKPLARKSGHFQRTFVDPNAIGQDVSIAAI